MRHRRGCATGGGEACTCRPGFQAQVWSPRDRRPIRRTFATVGEAKRWRQETQVAVHQQLARAPSQRTLGEAADEWLVSARAGIVRTRSGQPYKPSAIRSYQIALRAQHPAPPQGHHRLTTLTRHHVQALRRELTARGSGAKHGQKRDPASARHLPPRTPHRDIITTNPTRRLLLLPAVRTRRERVARPPRSRHPNHNAPLARPSPLGNRALRRAFAAANCKRCAGKTSTSTMTCSMSNNPGIASKDPSHPRATPDAAVSPSPTSYAGHCCTTACAKATAATASCSAPPRPRRSIRTRRSGSLPLRQYTSRIPHDERDLGVPDALASLRLVESRADVRLMPPPRIERTGDAIPWQVWMQVGRLGRRPRSWPPKGLPQHAARAALRTYACPRVVSIVASSPPHRGQRHRN